MLTTYRNQLAWVMLATISQHAQATFNWLQPAASLAATFIGAFLAYWLATRRELQKERKEQLVAYNRSLAVLLDLHNSLETFRQDCVSPFAVRADGWLNAPAVMTKEWGRFRFDHEGMVFILATKQSNLFHRLLLIESNFDALARTIRRDHRSALA